MKILIDKFCKNCDAEVKKAKFFTYIFTYRYKCSNCGVVYKLSALSSLAFTFIALVTIFTARIAWDIYQYISFPLVLLAVALLSGFLCNLEQDQP